MSRWVTWAKSRSRRRRSVRPRILRIDELENRRLLCSTLLGGSLERSFQDDEFEIEDRFETDEGDDLPLAATWGRAAVVDSRDAEGEDDEWEDETEDWTYTIPTTPISSNQVPAGSGDSSTAPSQVSPGNLFPTTATASSASELGESAESDSVLAFRVGNAFWFAPVVVLVVSGTHDEDASAEEDTPATSIANGRRGGQDPRGVTDADDGR